MERGGLVAGVPRPEVEALDEARVIAEVNATRPLSVLMAEQVNGLREWARSRTVPAD